jgi:hypothetical protein
MAKNEWAFGKVKMKTRGKAPMGESFLTDKWEMVDDGDIVGGKGMNELNGKKAKGKWTDEKMAK